MGGGGVIYKDCRLLLFLAVAMVAFVIATLKLNLEIIPKQNIYMDIKGYLHYNTITSRNVPSKAQIKNFFIS